MSGWAQALGFGLDAGLKTHDHVVKHQQGYNSRANDTMGYGTTYEEGKRLWKEHRDDGKAKSVLDNHWRFAPAECWNTFADGYDDAKNADGVQGRGPRKWF